MRRGPCLVATIALVLGTFTGCTVDQARDPRHPVSPPSATSGVGGLPERATLLLEPAEPSHLVQRGTAPVRIDLVSLQGGAAETVDGPLGVPAIELPPFTRAALYPRAVFRVVSVGDDQLSPGLQPLVWGADFMLDARSRAKTGVDNGDNLVQRGLSDQAALYKAELDRDRAGCTVIGTAGELRVTTREQAQPGIWYRLRCRRVDNTLSVSLQPLEAREPATPYTAIAKGPIGAIVMKRGIPLSIGGKLKPDGSIFRSATDQFNGRIASPLVDIG